MRSYSNYLKMKMKTMKRIKNIRQLKAEKERLRHRNDELEKAIRYDWRDFKDSLKPKNLAGQFFSSVFKKKDSEEQHSFLKDSVLLFADRITRKLAEKAEAKIDEWFKK